MRHDYYRFAKVNNDVWEGYGPGSVTTFMGEDSKTMDTWDDYIARYNKKHPDSPIDKTEYFNHMISEVW